MKLVLLRVVEHDAEAREGQRVAKQQLEKKVKYILRLMIDVRT
jgi:hypothetical protein